MAAETRRLKIGHTAITWPDEMVGDAVRVISDLGFHGIEVFSWLIAGLKEAGRSDIFRANNIPLVSSYFSVDIVDPSKQQGEMERLVSWGGMVKALGADFATLGGNGIDRRRFAFRESQCYITTTLVNMGRRLADIGLRLVFHPHTGTPVEKEDEIRAVLDGVNPSYVGFAPDVGQIQKGGGDPLSLVRHYISLVGLVHLKDFSGTVTFDANGVERDSSGFCCYSPLGKGVVDLPGLLAFLEASSFEGYVMVELDPGRDMPMAPQEAVRINKEYLSSLGYTFLARRAGKG
jgi:inosose dehydratase